MTLMSSRVIYRSHLGLGDHILCNGLVRYLSETFNLIVPVKKHYFDSVQFMYSDLSNVEVKHFLDDNDCDRYCHAAARTGIRVIWNGDFGPLKKKWERSNKNFDEKFYEQLGIDFRYRWDKFKIPAPSIDWKTLFKKAFPDEEPQDFAFVHSTYSRGDLYVDERFIIREKVYRPNPRFTKNIFDYVDLLRNASEVHCVNSSFLCLADSIDLKGELHFHHFPALQSTLNLRNKWHIHTYS